MRKFLFLLLCCCSQPIFAVSAENQSIKTLIVWENAEAGQMHFQLANGTWCYLTPGQKLLRSIVLTLYVSGKSADVVCYDAADSSSNSVPKAHKLHRIITK